MQLSSWLNIDLISINIIVLLNFELQKIIDYVHVIIKWIIFKWLFYGYIIKVSIDINLNC